jgi:hypothetical protein
MVEARGMLTSDELEGLGYKLFAVLVVLVVRHDCAGISGAAGVGVAAMAGGQRVVTK